MKNQFVISSLLLIPAFFLVTNDIPWEKLSLKYIRRIGDRTNARNKLIELGYPSEMSYENFRYRQLILIFIALALASITWILLPFPLTSLALISIASAISVIILTEKGLSKELKIFRESIEADFPAIVEALTLALSAGESPLTSMQRIASRGQGALAQEFKGVITSVSEGVPFSTALDAMGRRVTSVAVRRFVDSIVIAVTRGAPLIDVLHSHAQEARDYQRNRLLSAAAKAELSMMIPVVFLILPISILFALWPSLANLNLFAQG